MTCREPIDLESIVSEKPRLEIDEIQKVSEFLAALPHTPVPATKRKIVALLAGDIQRARDNGHTLKEIARHLNARGFTIAYSTLRNALPRQKKGRSGKRTPRAPKADAARPSAAARLRVVAPVQERVTRAGPPATSQGPPVTPRAPDGAVPPVVFPPGAACVFTGDGCFVPAPDSDDL